MGDVTQIIDRHTATDANVAFWKGRCRDWRRFARHQRNRLELRNDIWFLGGVCIGAVLMWLGLA